MERRTPSQTRLDVSLRVFKLQTGPCYHDPPYHRDHSTLPRGRQKYKFEAPQKILQLVNFRRSLRAVSFLKGEKYLISEKYMAMAAGCFFNNSKTVKFVTIIEHLKLL